MSERSVAQLAFESDHRVQNAVRRLSGDYRIDYRSTQYPPISLLFSLTKSSDHQAVRNQLRHAERMRADTRVHEPTNDQSTGLLHAGPELQRGASHGSGTRPPSIFDGGPTGGAAVGGHNRNGAELFGSVALSTSGSRLRPGGFESSNIRLFLRVFLSMPRGHRSRDGRARGGRGRGRAAVDGDGDARRGASPLHLGLQDGRRDGRYDGERKVRELWEISGRGAAGNGGDVVEKRVRHLGLELGFEERVPKREKGAENDGYGDDYASRHVRAESQVEVGLVGSRHEILEIERAEFEKYIGERAGGGVWRRRGWDGRNGRAR